MPQANKIIEVMTKYQNKYNLYSLGFFNKQFDKLKKELPKVKDLSENMSTLEGSFKCLSQDLDTLEQNIPSLVSELKNTWAKS